jgi:hypothetical protein
VSVWNYGPNRNWSNFNFFVLNFFSDRFDLPILKINFKKIKIKHYLKVFSNKKKKNFKK